MSHDVLPLLKSMNPYDVLVGFPDDRHIDVFFGSWQPGPASLPVAPSIVPYVTRQLANVSTERAAELVGRLSDALGEGADPAQDPDALADRVLSAFKAAPPTFSESDAFQSSISGRGPRYRRYFFGQVPLGPNAGRQIDLAVRGFGLGARRIEDASARSVGAVVAAGLRKAVPPVLESVRKLESLPDMPEELKRNLRAGDGAETLELLEEFEFVATRAIVDAVRAISAAALSASVTVATQSDVNGRVLDEVSPWIDKQLALEREVQESFDSWRAATARAR